MPEAQNGAAEYCRKRAFTAGLGPGSERLCSRRLATRSAFECLLDSSDPSLPCLDPPRDLSVFFMSVPHPAYEGLRRLVNSLRGVPPLAVQAR